MPLTLTLTLCLGAEHRKQPKAVPISQGMSAHTIIVLPTYNEADNITNAIRGIHAHAPEVDILIVDDNSPDGTGDIADTMATNNHHIHVLHRTGKSGLGPAYIAGFGWALDHGYDYIAQMDADGSHQPKHLPALFAAARTHDLTIGSRWTTGGGTENWPLHRQILSRSGSLYARIMLGLPYGDITGGYRVLKADTLRAIDLTDIQSHGYCFQIDLACRVHAIGLTITEVPIIFKERVAGKSKMSSDIVKEAILKVTIWGYQRHIAKLKTFPRIS